MIKDIPVVDVRGKAFLYYGGRFISIGDAHELLECLAVAIGNAQGRQDAMDGKVSTPTDCPRCKARNVTPRHQCRTAKQRSSR